LWYQVCGVLFDDLSGKQGPLSNVTLDDVGLSAVPTLLQQQAETAEIRSATEICRLNKCIVMALGSRLTMTIGEGEISRCRSGCASNSTVRLAITAGTMGSVGYKSRGANNRRLTIAIGTVGSTRQRSRCAGDSRLAMTVSNRGMRPRNGCAGSGRLEPVSLAFNQHLLKFHLTFLLDGALDDLAAMGTESFFTGGGEACYSTCQL